MYVLKFYFEFTRGLLKGIYGCVLSCVKINTFSLEAAVFPNVFGIGAFWKSDFTVMFGGNATGDVQF